MNEKQTKMKFFGLILGITAISYFVLIGETGDKTQGFIRQSLEQIKVIADNKEVAIHHSGDALDKPFIHPLWTPDRRVITYDAPADHIHHRGLSVGWPDVSGMDFWAEINTKAGTRGKIKTLKTEVTEDAQAATHIMEHNQWIGEDGKILVGSRHEWIFLPPKENLQRVNVDLQLTAEMPEVVFGSDPGVPREYHGLTLRIGPFTDPRYFNSQGDEGGQNCKGKPAKWCACSGLQSGRPVLAAILDSPNNESHPTKFYVQDQGMQFISSSPNYGEPKILKKGETWHLQYQVIAAGAPPEEESWDLNALWEEYAKSLKSQ